jgi:hypothetical protein
MGPVRSAELCGAVSLFTDLGTGQPTEHALRTCIVAMRLADGLGVGDDVRLDVFYGSLIRFLGCTADARPAQMPRAAATRRRCQAASPQARASASARFR